MKDQKIDAVIDLIKKEKAEDAKNLFALIVPEESTEYWMCKGILEQKYQNWGEAINAFNKVLEIDSDNKEAQNNLHLIQNIINFWNPEMFNP
jgi:tetratricopeptide (TPR) repeat protein